MLNLEMTFAIEVCSSFEALTTTDDYGFDLDGDEQNEAVDISSRAWLRGLVA
jgi:hypothetical protein